MSSDINHCTKEKYILERVTFEAEFKKILVICKICV